MRLGASMISLAALALAGCMHVPPAGQVPVAESAPVAPTATDWALFRDNFVEEYFRRYPNFAVYAGRHEFDGQLPDWSAAGIGETASFLQNAIVDAQAMTGLSADDALQRDQMVLVAKDALFQLTDEQAPFRNPAFYSYALDPNVYIARPYASSRERMEAFIAYADNIPAAAAQIQANLKLPLPRTFLKYAQAGFDGFADYYRADARAAFADVEDAALQARLVQSTDAAAAAMDALSQHLASVPPKEAGFALGAENFSKMVLVGEGVDVPLDRLEAIGRADLARNQAALKEACSIYAPGISLGDCMLKMQEDKPAIGPVEEAREQLPDLRAFLIAKGLVTIPGTEQALVEESPPYNRQNSAYIDIPGPFETGLPSVYYISPPDPSWDEATREAFIPSKKDLLFTSVHEIWPGHFLQFLHSNRSRNQLSRIFVTYGLAEGWAHYGEEMMWEAGLGDGDPETHIGQLSNALLRNCRYLSAIGLHARGMTVAESEDLFRNECYQDNGTAIQQAARGTYDPRYLNYTLGKLMIRRLREDWTASRGGRSAWKEFHDSFLSYGGPPVPLIRKAMMEESDARAVF